MAQKAQPVLVGKNVLYAINQAVSAQWGLGEWVTAPARKITRVLTNAAGTYYQVEEEYTLLVRPDGTALLRSAVDNVGTDVVFTDDPLRTPTNVVPLWFAHKLAQAPEVVVA